MAQFTHGMNVEEVRQTGEILKQQATNIRETMISTIDQRVASTTWEGPDAQQFKNDWWPKHKQMLIQIATELEGLGTSAINNAREQEEISSR